MDFAAFLQVMSRDLGDTDEVCEAFKVFDQENTGFVNADVLKNAIKSFGEILTEEEAEELIREADSNEDGKISYKSMYAQ